MNIAIIRVNDTTFNFSLEVRYTGAGGGNLTLTNIMFREVDTMIWNHHSPHRVELIQSGRTWYALVTNSEFAAIGDAEFLFTTQNVMNQGVEMKAGQIISK
jgi:hypothetical protein